MKIEKILSGEALLSNKFCNRVFPIITTLLILIANYFAFVVAPDEAVMGPVQRIFYFHVGSAVTSYLMIGILFFASVFYLVTKKPEWDFVAQSAGFSAFLFCTVVLLSGMIWGHSAWNVWWRWEPRLVSFLVLWLILFSYVTLRSFVEGQAGMRNFMAALGIVAAVNVPIVVFSIKLLSHAEQLHPEVVANQGLKDPRYIYALIISMVAVTSMALWFFYVKLSNLVIAWEMTKLKKEK